jgi:hypothetical protein
MSAQWSLLTGWRKLAGSCRNVTAEEVARIRSNPKHFVATSLVILAATIVAAVSGGLVRFDQCRVTPNLQPLGGNVDAMMTVQGGHACSIRPGTWHSLSEVIHLTAWPRNGIVTKHGSIGLTYRPNPRFRGDDFFSFAATGGPRSEPTTTWVQVRVRVR